MLAAAPVDLQACARLIGGTLQTIEPDRARRAAFDDAYGAYRALFSSLEPMFARAGPASPPASSRVVFDWI